MKFFNLFCSVLFIIFCNIGNSESGIFFLTVLLKIVGLDSIIHVGLPLALGSFILGAGLTVVPLISMANIGPDGELHLTKSIGHTSNKHSLSYHHNKGGYQNQGYHSGYPGGYRTTKYSHNVLHPAYSSSSYKRAVTTTSKTTEKPFLFQNNNNINTLDPFSFHVNKGPSTTSRNKFFIGAPSISPERINYRERDPFQYNSKITTTYPNIDEILEKVKQQQQRERNFSEEKRVNKGFIRRRRKKEHVKSVSESNGNGFIDQQSAESAQPESPPEKVAERKSDNFGGSQHFGFVKLPGFDSIHDNYEMQEEESALKPVHAMHPLAKDENSPPPIWRLMPNPEENMLNEMRHIYLQELNQYFNAENGWTSSDLSPAIPWQMFDPIHEFPHSPEFRTFTTIAPNGYSSTIGPHPPPKPAFISEEDSRRKSLLQKNFGHDVEEFFKLVNGFDENSCLEKLVCDIHAKSGEPKRLGLYEKNIIHTFKVINGVLPMKGKSSKDDSSYKYRIAAAIGSEKRSEKACQIKFPACKLSSDQIIKVGNKVQSQL